MVELVFGGSGLVGSAIVRNLRLKKRISLHPTRKDVDCMDFNQVNQYIGWAQPSKIYVAAAKVGGIVANYTYPADFIEQNLMISTNIIRAALKNKVKDLIYIGSSCVYPNNIDRPIKESDLLSGPLEPTNRAYAVAKIAAMELCRHFTVQYGVNYRCVMPCNSFGRFDSYDLQNGHALPVMIHKFHEAKMNNSKSVELLGDGTPRREFIYSDDLANGIVHFANQPRYKMINIGSGVDITIKELAETIKSMVGYKGEIVWQGSDVKNNGTMRKVMDVTKIKELGWRPIFSFQEALELTYISYLKGDRRN